METEAPDLDSPHGRLRWARLRMYASPSAFARKAKIHPTTYRAHESGQNGFAKKASDFAELLGIPTDWLLRGGPLPTKRAPATPESNALPIRLEGASMERMREDLPVYGTALGAARIVEGDAIEQTMLNQGEIIAYAKRPVVLNGNAKAYALYVQGSSMYPAHNDGEMILAERDRPFRTGDDVVVYLRPMSEEDDDGDRARTVLVKRFIKRNSQFVELEQFSPALTFRVAMDEVLRIDRVFRLDDLLS